MLVRDRPPDDCPESVASIISECLSSNPPERPTAKDVAVRLRAIAQNRLLNHPSRGSWGVSKELWSVEPAGGASVVSQRTTSGSSIRTNNNLSGMPPLAGLAPSKLSFRTSLERISGPASISNERALSMDRTPLDGAPPSLPKPVLAAAASPEGGEWAARTDGGPIGEELDTGPVPVFSPFAYAINTQFSSGTCPSGEITTVEGLASPSASAAEETEA